MASKKKKQEAVETATVVDVAPAAEAPATEEAAPVEVAQAEQAAEVTEEKPAGDRLVEAIEQLEAVLTSDQPIITMPAGFELTVVDYEDEFKRQAERKQLDEMWRMGGVAELLGIEEALRGLMPGIKARRDVHRPAQLGDVVLTTAELIKALEDAASEWASVLRRWYRANHRRAGTSIYARLALAELEEGVSDEQGQDEGSADV